MWRPWPIAAWQARAAVLSGMPLADFLRARLARYEVRLPLPVALLPLRIELAETEIGFTAVELPPDVAPPDASDPALALATLDGPSAARRAEELRARVSELEQGAAAAALRAEELRARFDADVAEGKLLPAYGVEADPGRPRVRSVLSPALPIVAAGVAVLAEAWALAVPILEDAGVSIAALARLPPGEVPKAVITCVFGIGLSLGLFVLARAALAAAEALGREAHVRGRRRWLAAALLASALGAVGIAATAALPSGSRFGRALFLLAVPAGAALLTRRGRRELEARALEVEAALAWDRKRTRALGARARRQSEVAAAEATARDLSRQRHRVRARARELALRSAAAAEILARAARRDEERRARLARSLIGALERDRYEFLRQATARGALDLLGGRRKPPEPHAPSADHSPSAGRMAG